MLDRAHAGAHRALDAFGAVRVGGDEGAARAASSTAARISASLYSDSPGSVPAVSTAPVAITLMKSAPPSSRSLHLLPHLALGVGDAAAELVGHHRALGQPGDLAAAAGDGDVGAGHEHARPGHVAGVDRIAQGDIGEAAIDADIAHGGEAGAHGIAGVPRADEGIARRGALQRRAGVGGLALVGEVRVQVHQARQHGVARPVEHLGIADGGGRVRLDTGDALAFDADRLVGEHLAVVDVDQVAGADDRSPGLRGGAGPACAVPISARVDAAASVAAGILVMMCVAGLEG